MQSLCGDCGLLVTVSTLAILNRSLSPLGHHARCGYSGGIPLHKRKEKGETPAPAQLVDGLTRQASGLQASREEATGVSRPVNAAAGYRAASEASSELSEPRAIMMTVLL
jgi:hypothetical protein